MENPGHRTTTSERAAPTKALARRLRAHYENSFAQELFHDLGEVDFGDRILIFGATMLLSVLPLIIVLSAFASHRIQDDIAQHLGLSKQGARIVDALFHASVSSFNVAILIGLLLSFAGTITVARSVQTIYERSFKQPHAVGMKGMLRSVVWVLAVGGVLIGDSAVAKALRDGPAGPAVIGLVEFVGFTLFFWWSIHFLLGGRETWRHTRPAAVATAFCWVGLGVFAAFYFSSTIVSDSKTYGTIGVTFTLVTWFIAIGAVLTLGAVVGVVWQNRKDRRKAGTGGPDAPAGRIQATSTD
ncbi:MAG TPA: YhjD/YihY/BrkB family envelope integrity protein [Acidimicrobiales bacterium]|nr:YhjD/YihY/BrkB family envelope integrity protein [Acidimicrobiales bacterium]